jgi:hypothetical protein
MTLDELKEAYWNCFTTSTKYPKPFGVTAKRLEKIKPTIMTDQSFWQDVLFRHGCDKYPDPHKYLEEKDAFTVEHCQGNFWGMIAQTMLEKGILKP